jgi:hypothetical protein
MNYKIIHDEAKLDEFLTFLPDLQDGEVYYVSLFGRHKYCPALPNKYDNQLSRFISQKDTLKEKIRRLESPVGSYCRDGITVPQEALALYIGLNPRSLIEANKNLLKELAERFADGKTNFNPISLANTCVHRATDRKVLIDFDYDNISPNAHLAKLNSLLPENSFKILVTKGGFHLVVILEYVKLLRNNWYKELVALENCDVKGTDTLSPVPGCTQGNFCPYFLE